MTALLIASVWAPLGHHLAAKASSRAPRPYCCTRTLHLSRRQAAWRGTARSVLHGSLGRTRPAYLGGRAAIAVCAADFAAQEKHMQDQLSSARPGSAPSPSPQPPSPRQKRRLPGLPCVADLKHQWAPGLVLCAMTRAFSARELASLLLSGQVHLLVVAICLAFLHQQLGEALIIKMGLYTAALYYVWLCSKHCGGEASKTVVLVTSGFCVGLDLPLHLYQYINSIGGGPFIAYVHRVMFYMGGILLIKAALKAFSPPKQAPTPKAGGSFTSQEKTPRTAKPSVLRADVPTMQMAEKSYKGPLQSLEPNSGLSTSSLRSRMQQSFPAAAPDGAASAALAEAKRQVHLLHLQQSVDRLVHAEDRK